MKTWSAVFNLIAVLIIALSLMMFGKVIKTNDRQFEEVRLSYAVDYATEAAFRSAISTDTIGTDYIAGGLEEVKINPSLVLNTFYNIICLNYDMSTGQENFDRIEQSIATGLLCGVDGYYVLENAEVDNDTTDSLVGLEYGLKWGVKRPYIVYNNDGRLFAANLVNEKTIEFVPKVSVLPKKEEDAESATLVYRDNYNDAHYGNTGLNSELVKQSISLLLTEDLNKSIHARNIDNTGHQIHSFYIPSGDSMTAINNIKSPSLIILFQDSTFLNGYDIDAVSVGGTRVRIRKNVIGFEKNGEKLYCYAGQQLGESGITIKARFNTIHEAAEAGYSPDFVLLTKPLTK